MRCVAHVAQCFGAAKVGMFFEVWLKLFFSRICIVTDFFTDVSRRMRSHVISIILEGRRRRAWNGVHVANTAYRNSKVWSAGQFLPDNKPSPWFALREQGILIARGRLLDRSCCCAVAYGGQSPDTISTDSARSSFQTESLEGNSEMCPAYSPGADVGSCNS